MSLRSRFSIVPLAALVLSAGCSILPESNPATLYRLPPPATQAEQTAVPLPQR